MRDLFVNREYRRAQEIEADFFDDNLEGEKISQSGHGFLGKFISENKINFFSYLVMACLLILLGRTMYLQIFKGQYYQLLADSNRTREKILPAARGLIYDSQNQPLVKNLPIFNATILPKDLSLNNDKRLEEINSISQILNIASQPITDLLAKYPKNFKYPLLIKENLSYEEAIDLKIKAAQFTGLYIDAQDQRQYFSPVDFAHILGYEGKITEKELDQHSQDGYNLNDYIGKTGLELSYESVLRGKFGQEGIEVDAAGHEDKVLYHEDPVNGKSLVLSVDQKVQNKVREILINHLHSLNKKKGAVIMLNPQNGEVLALVSYPDFDLNLFAQGISEQDYNNLLNDENQPLFDRAVKGEYPSGSTIKPVIAAGALQAGIITDKTTVNSTGGLWLYDRWFFPDWAAGGHGITNVYKAIAWSVNTFFYMIGGGYEDFKGLGIEGLEKYFKIFGLGDKTGIDLSGEATGLVPDPDWKKKTKNEDWFIGDTYHAAIGQGDVLVTPLQVANYTTAFLNGGKLYEPHLVKEIISNDGSKQIIEPKIIRENFIDDANLEIVKKAMRQTVTLGSAQYLNSLNVAVGGKTGTAQWNTEKNPQAWFTGFAPYDQPEVAITVLVEEGGEGSSACVPITYDILNWYFNVYKKGV